jgi:glycosyltransferase involved in cell wall biosynthesis
MNESCSFTVFTAIYNRAHTIKRVFDSLCAQTRRDFEWLVVDDGSTDNTSELIAGWAKTADFPIRYFKQKNSGKHIAYNLALREARGQFFLPLDSDDAFTPIAMASVAHHWAEIPEPDKRFFCGIGGLCCDQYGKTVGDRFPSEPFDTDMRKLKYVYRVRGEKWAALQTEVARHYPFAEVHATQFIPETTVWFEIAKTYKIRWFNEVYRVYYVDDEATGVTLTQRRNLSVNAPGFLYYYLWLLNNDLGYFFYSPMPFLKAALVLPIVAQFSGMRFGQAFRSLNRVPAKALVLMALPLSILLYIFDITCRRRSE